MAPARKYILSLMAVSCEQFDPGMCSFIWRYIIMPINSVWNNCF